MSKSKFEAASEKALAEIKSEFVIKPITNDDEARLAAHLDGEIKAEIDKLTELRFSITRPIDAAKAKVMDLFRPRELLLINFRKANKAEIIRWDNAKLEERRKAQEEENRRAAELERQEKEKLRAAAEKAMESGDVAKAQAFESLADTTEIRPANKLTEARPGVAIRTVWKFQVVDESKVPDIFWSIDEKKIGAMVKSGTRSIDGVKIWSENV